GLAQAGSGGAEAGGHGGGGVRAAVQQGGDAGPDPGPGGRAVLGEQAPGGVPQGLADVDQGADDRDGDAAGGGLGRGLGDLVPVVLVPVGQRDPPHLAGRVAAVGLGEDGGYHLGGRRGHARGQPLALGPGARRAGTGAQDVPGGTRGRGDGEHGAGGGHP